MLACILAADYNTFLFPTQVGKIAMGNLLATNRASKLG